MCPSRGICGIYIVGECSCCILMCKMCLLCVCVCCCVQLASHPGSPAFIQLERKKKVTKNKKMCSTLKAEEPGISSSHA